jgi:hypothetical protein
MDAFRWIRAFWPTIFAIVGSMIAMFVLLPLQDVAGPLQPIVDLMKWVPLGFVGLAFLYAAWVCHRLHQAEKGVGPICPYCGGPLGQERVKYSPYRKCMLCGQNANERHYT